MNAGAKIHMDQLVQPRIVIRRVKEIQLKYAAAIMRIQCIRLRSNALSKIEGQHFILMNSSMVKNRSSLFCLELKLFFFKDKKSNIVKF